MSIAGGGLVCGPQNITGPVEHTLFLGCSIIDFTCTMGWNEQASSIDVNLVEDPCDAPLSHPKNYYPLPGQSRTTTGPDPGFIYPTIGAPVYFKVGSFEFAGVVQSWSRKNDTGGNPTFQISITDPRFLLENLQIIVSDYADSVENVYNLINVYGYLESLGYTCPESFIGGAAFGSPADAFGGSENNDEGTPWTKIRDATQALLTGNTHPDYSPYGFAVYRGNNPNNFGSLGGMGALNPDSFNAQTQASFNSGGYLANYYIDISEIPFAPTYYRIAGPSITLMALISQICDDAGCDFFVELFVTSSGEKIIKVRTAVRKLQPVLGQIEQFVDAQDFVTAKNIGRELRNEPTSVFGYGGYIESLYTQPDPSRIHQYWGADSQGATMNAVFVRNQHNMDPSIPEWWVDIDVTALTPNLFSPPAATTVQVSETEMRMALGGYESWSEYALFTGTAFGSWMSTLGPNGQSSTIKTQRKPSDRTRDGDASNNITVNTNLGLQNPGRYDAKDMAKVHKFISEYADTYYGKQFIIELPLICYAFDNDSNANQYSDNPNPQGGFPASTTTSILNLAYPNGDGMDFFLTDKDKVEPILRYIPASGSGTSVEGSNFVYQNNSLYLKGVTQESFIFRNGNPHALLTVSNPVKFSGLENGSPAAFGAYIKIAYGNGSGGNLSVDSDINGGKARSAWAMETKRITPDEVAVPMKSNTNRYGPWLKKGPPGPVTLVTDDSLVPWEYGGYTVMNLAAYERINDATTFMQVGERGSFTMPGYPIKGLGQEVRAAQPVMANFSVQSASFTINGTSVSYWYVATSPLDGTFGPNITQISTSVGSNGLTTTYSLATFTPSFGRMSKLNAGRIKKVAAQRQSMLKEQRRQRKLSVAASQVAQRVSQQSVERRAVAAVAPASNVIMGAIVDTVETDGTKVGSKAPVVGIGSTINKASSDVSNTEWTKQAMMGPEGFFRPVSKFGGMNTSSSRSSGFLPQYTRRRYNSTYEGGLSCPSVSRSGTNSSGPKHSTPPLQAAAGGGSGKDGYSPLAIYQDFLDPFATPSTDKHLLTGVSKTGTHHDVDTVAFGGNNPNGQIMSLMENENQGNAFPDDFRMMALRGPLLINGWGYDLEGKPIPNSADTSAATSVGKFVDSNLTNSFPENWLREPDTWPVAPLDLRFDRVRGVWTTPPPQRMLFGEINQAMAGGHKGPGSETGIATIWNSDFPDSPSGTPLYASSDPQIIFTNVLNTSGLKSGDKAYFHWDPNSCTYFPITDVTGGGGGTTAQYKDLSVCDTSGTVVSDCSGIECLTMSSGLSINYVSDDINGTGYHLMSDLQISDRYYCGYSPEIEEGRFFKMLALGSGLQLEDTANCTYTINAEHLISHIDCEDAVVIQPTFFNKLTFHTGIMVDADGDCGYTISSSHKVNNEPVCGQSSSVATFKKYENLSFRSGLKLEPLGSCDYGIDADIRLKDSVSNACVYTPTVTTYKNFTKLNFGSGLGVFEDTENCEYTVNSTNQAKIRGLEWCDRSLVAPSVFTGVAVGEGLTLTSLGTCDFSIKADRTITNSAASISDTFFRQLTFAGDGLTVSDDSNCNFTVSVVDPLIYDWGCQGGPGASYGNESICAKGGSNGIIAKGAAGLDGIVFGYGLDAVMATGAELAGTVIVNTKLKIQSPTSVGGYVQKVESIDLGCGLKAVHAGSETCAAISSQELCAVTIAIDPLENQGTIQEVNVVNGICCTGAHISASFLTLRFTSCGLFIEATGGSTCCE